MFCIPVNGSAAVSTLRGRVDRGLLLRQAVERSQAPHKVHRVYADHRAIGKQVRQDAESQAIIRIVECRNEHGLVRDVEISVAGGQPLALQVQGGGHRNERQLGPSAVFQSKALGAFPVFLKRPVVGVLWIGLAAEDERSRADEPAQVIDMPVRVVTCDAFSEPQHVPGAEILGQDEAKVLLVEARIARLDIPVQQAFLRRDQAPTAIDV